MRRLPLPWYMGVVCLLAIISCAVANAQGVDSTVRISQDTQVQLSLVIAAVTVALSIGGAASILRTVQRDIAESKAQRAEMSRSIQVNQEELRRHTGDISIHTEGGQIMLRTDCSATHADVVARINTMRDEILQRVAIQVENAVLNALRKVPMSRDS